MDYYSSYGTETGVLAMLGGFFIVIAIIMLAYVVVSIIGKWKMFAKAGEDGWKAIVPIYNVYTQCKIVGINTWWVLIFFLSPILNVIPVIGSLAQTAVMIYFSILLAISTANSYGKDTGFGIGLFFLAPIFECILGFGSSQYVGAKPMNDFVFKNNGQNAQATPNAQPTATVASGKNCPNCGAAVPSDSAFCTSCGTKVD